MTACFLASATDANNASAAVTSECLHSVRSLRRIVCVAGECEGASERVRRWEEGARIDDPFHSEGRETLTLEIEKREGNEGESGNDGRTAGTARGLLARGG